MIYKSKTDNNFDRSFQYKKQRFLCLSDKEIKSSEILGVANLSDKNAEGDDFLQLGKQRVAVRKAAKKSFLQKTVGYIPVGDNQFLEVRQSRAMFLGLLSSLLVVTVIACILIVTLVGRTDNTALHPLPPVDLYIQPAATLPEETKPSEIPAGGGSVTMTYRTGATLNLTTGMIDLEYQNPAGSTHDVVLELYIVDNGEEYKIAQSGRIPAGSMLETMELTAEKSLVSEGVYNARYRVLYYDAVTGEKAITDSALDNITLTVKEG